MKVGETRGEKASNRGGLRKRWRRQRAVWQFPSRKTGN